MRKVLFATLTILTVAFGSLSFTAPANAATDNVISPPTVYQWGDATLGGA